MTAFATAADMVKRCDVRELGDLVADNGVRVGLAELLTSTNLQAALDDAAGEIIAALMQGRRYSRDDLDNLTGDSKQYLIRLNCQLARAYLWERRKWASDDFADRYEDAIASPKKKLEQLRRGEHVLDLDAPKDAGLPSITTPSVTSIQRQNLVVDRARAGFYLNRSLPY